MKIEQGYTKAQMTWLMMLRLFIGWHFMYEGLVKIMNPKWTDRKSTRLNSSHIEESRMPSSA